MLPLSCVHPALSVTFTVIVYVLFGVMFLFTTIVPSVFSSYFVPSTKYSYFATFDVMSFAATVILKLVSVCSVILGSPTSGFTVSLDIFIVNGADSFPALSYAMTSIFHFPSVSISIFSSRLNISFLGLSLNILFVLSL